MPADVATAQPLFEGLNASQRAAVEATTGPVCILAGAGSGKTRTITHRIANQVHSGVARADQVLAVTFTDKAASELRRRLRGLGIARPVRAATFHAAAWAQLRHFWPRISDRPLPEVVPSKLRLLIALANRVRADAKDLAAEIEWAKARSVPPDGYVRAAKGRTTPVDPTRMAELYDRYERRKADEGLLDYEDMLLETTRMLVADAAIASAVRERYRFFTVDEFQDVNPAQWELLRAWLGDSDELCVVGDDDQTIYTFTGASSSYLIGFKRHFPKARTVSLVDNYRSSAEGLTVANRVLRSRASQDAKRLQAQRSGGAEPRIEGFRDADAEVRAVVRRASTLIEGGVVPGQIAVIYRVNSQSEPLEEAFMRAGIPASVRDAGGFFGRPEIRQALGVLRSAVARQPQPEVPGPSGAESAGPPRADRQVERVLREQLSWHPRREPAGDAARERWRNLAALLGVVERAVADDPAVTLADVVNGLERRGADGETITDDAGAVNLLTYHKAKGLEFDAVFLIALEEGLLPISYAKTEAEIAEERRLLYVGITRAREHLWLSWADRRPGWRGKPTQRRVSRFLDGVRAVDRRPAGAATADAHLAERLRTWRRERARADDVPAFVVFNDQTLTELAARRPTTASDLLAVRGIGPAKLDRYGGDLLRVLGEG